MQLTSTEYYTPQQACNRLGVSKMTMLRWLRAGKVLHEPTPLGRLYPREEIERLAQEREQAKLLAIH